VRAVWTWPLATGAVTAAELAARDGTFDAVAFGLACTSGAAMGAWLALLAVLVAIMAQRRGWSVPARLRPSARTTAILAAASVLALVVVAIGWRVLDVVLATVAEHPLDYPQTGTQLGRAGVLLTVPLGVLLVVALAFPLARRLEDGARALTALRVTGIIAVAALAMHFGSGPFVIYFGPRLVLGIVVLAAIVAALWLPASRPGSAGLFACGCAVGVILVGVLALRHPGARALLLHHGRLTPTLVALGIGVFDGDDDGDLPPWLGGGDCDDGDPRISIAATEVLDNGIDDNCWGGERTSMVERKPPIVDGPRPTIVLVTIDTVRPDRLELYGASRPTMPALADLANRGALFERAYAPANHTFYAMTAMLAGQATERMLVPVSGDLPGMRYTRWLPQRLRELGYHVVSIAPPLVQDGKLSLADMRVDEIDVGPFDSGAKNRGTVARQVADAAIERIDGWKGERPLALWIHFMDPHAVHESPVRFPVESVVDAYDNELSWVDLHLSRVLAAVQERFGDDALVVVTADHGESFGEDGGWGHGFTLSEREIRVPLVIAGPGVAPGRRSMPVSTLAIPTTVLALLRQPADPALAQPSLLEDATAPVVAENPAFLWNALRMEAALVEVDRKLVWSRTTNTLQLFDLAADPDEHRNLADVDPDARDRMLATLRDALEAGL
jgi:choline-sulfatase